MKTKIDNNHILSEHITSLPFGKELIAAATDNELNTLGDILRKRTDEVEKLPGFNILLVHEYVSFVESRGLGRLIDPWLPSRNS